MKVVTIIQARLGSSRLPGKILKKVNGKEMLLYMVERLQFCNNISDVIVSTTTNVEDDRVSEFCLKNKIKCFRGSENNVLERFYQLASLVSADIVVRCTGDCPLIDPHIVDDMLMKFRDKEVEYYTMQYESGADEVGVSCFPDGFAAEIFTFEVLKEAYSNALEPTDMEHVTPYIIRNYENKLDLYKIYDLDLNELRNKYPNIDFRKLHLSVDTIEHLNIVKSIASNFGDLKFSITDILDFLNSHPHLLIETEIKDSFKGKGQELYNESKKLIPGGTQLLSKRPEMFLPDLWPAYYQQASGIEITTLDGVKMQDFSIMGIGACILGYCDKEVNAAVKTCIDKGNMTSLNSPKEFELTKLLLEIHPWASMARYCKGGGEATTIAIRISRAASKKDKVAFCGYHGWNDWYLSANWNSKNALGEHLLGGLSPEGVPKNLKDTAFPFKYNDIQGLLHILDKHDIGTIIMEPIRSEEPRDGFLHKIREICNNKGIILIFDEVSSAFRLNSGGIHLLYDVNPDIAVFAKAMGNGYPIGAIIGKGEVMSIAEETFISSTYWTEDVGFSAAIATIKKHARCKVGDHIKELGMYFQREIKKIADNTGIKLTISGLPCFSAFTFDYPNSLAIKTLYVQEMLKKNILAKNALYLSYAHKRSDIDFYLENISEIFIVLNKAIEEKQVEELLLGPIVHTGFKRLC